MRWIFLLYVIYEFEVEPINQDELTMSLHVIILAAGQGTRMKTSKPKVLHGLAGKPLLGWVIETAQKLEPEAIHVVYGHAGEILLEALGHYPVHWVKQQEQLGTGHAVLQALAHIPREADVIILSGDVPLIQATTLKELLQLYSPRNSLCLLLGIVEPPTGLGRILRNKQKEIYAIKEERDATNVEKQITEIYSGICCTNASNLARWLPQLSKSKVNNEYYLTEIIAMAVSERLPIVSLQATDLLEIQGVNTLQQLHYLERAWQKQMAEQLLLAGVILADASRIDIRGKLHCEQDVSVDINTVFSGEVVLGNGCSIGPNCILHNVKLGANCEILANSILEGCELGNYCQIGPFARIRPGTKLADKCKIGNFVETKQAEFGTGSKASHLSYLGDIQIGKQVNIGAGTITCNYDGANKHQTIIEDGAFIGSDTQLVAPIHIGANATIGAGSTIRKNAPPNELTLSENKQKTVVGWLRPKKK